MRRTALARRAPLDRRSALRRVALVHGCALARKAVTPRRKTTRGEFPPRVRLLLWCRWDGLCCVCWRPLPRRGWTAQHRRSRGMGGSYDRLTTSPANGLAVHELPCHRRIEDNPAEALAHGWRVPQGTDPATAPLSLPDGSTVLLRPDGTYEESL